MCDKIAPQTGGFRGETLVYMGFQHLFHRRSSDKSREKDDVAETFKLLIATRFDRLESDFANLRREWADANEKLMLLYDRSRKRLQVIQKASQAEEPIDPTPAPPMTQDEVLQAYLRQNGA